MSPSRGPTRTPFAAGGAGSPAAVIAERRVFWTGLLTQAAELGAQAARGEALSVRATSAFGQQLVMARDVRFPLPGPMEAAAAEGFRHLARAFTAAPVVSVPPELGLALVQAANLCVRLIEIADEAAEAAFRRRYPD